MNLAQGVRLGPYEIGGQLGAGGMGQVWRARDTRLGRDVAVKVLPDDVSHDPKVLARFESEARAVAALSHPNILALYDVGEANGVRYAVTELLEGETLRDALRHGALPVRRALEISEQLAKGLAAAHEKGIVHRDVKPENVFLTKGGDAKLLDFGLARQTTLFSDPADTHSPTEPVHTTSGAVIGTVAYMSPEQARGLPIDHRSDQFSLGIVLYEMLAGRRPFHGDSAPETLIATIREEPEALEKIAPAVPAPARWIVERCLAKEPAGRYDSTRDLAQDLSNCRLHVADSGTGVPGAPARARPPRRLIVAAIASLALVATLAVLVVRRKSGVQPTSPAALQGLPLRIVVLPFESLSADPEQRYLAEGIHEALITDLAKISSLSRVIARTSAMRYEKTAKPLSQVARELGVDAIITGSVLRVANRVRVTAHLINPATEEHLWSESFERELRDVLSLQNEIVAAIIRTGHLKLSGEETVRLATARTVNPDAYEAYLKGKFHLNKMTPDGYEKGLASLNQAVEKDPTNPLPYAALALGYSLVGHERHPDAFARARAAARKAEELGGEPLAEMYLAFGMAKLYSDWDYMGAEKDLRRALDLNPSLGEAHRDYSWYLFLVGRRDEALAEMKRAQEVEPLTPLFAADRGWQYWWIGKNDEALVEARKSLDLDPNFNEGLHVLGSVYAEMGMYAEALEAHRKLAEVDPDWRWSLARTYAQAGRKDEAREALAKFLKEKPEPTGAWAGWFLAEAYAALAEKDEALRWLEAAYRERHSFLPWINDNRAYASLRSDPRFQDLQRRIGVYPKGPRR
jgi:TolB-like protein/Tfp pilus assembly protein PilF